MSKLVVLACVIGALAVAPAALADSSTVLGGYGSNGAKAVIKVPVTQVKGVTAAKAPTTTTATASGTLPFTGSDLTLFVVGGVLLVGLGVGLRRLKSGDN